MLILGVLLQFFGLLFFLIFSVGIGAFSLYSLFTGASMLSTELGNTLTGLSFFGFIPLVLLIIGFALVRKTSNLYFSNVTVETLGKLVIVPISVVLAASLAIIMVPFLAYRFYQYKKGLETDTIKFIKWTTKGWYVTLPIYVLLVLITFTLM